MAAVDDLTTAYNQVCANLKTITVTPKPTYSIDGVNVSWKELYDSYIQQMLTLEQAIQRAGGPYQKTSRATT